MQAGTQDRKKLIFLAALVLVAGYVLYRAFAPAAEGPAASPRALAKAEPTIANLDPRLHLARLDQLRAIRYGGNGRDLFKLGPAPPPPSAARSAALAGGARGPNAGAPPAPFRPAGPPPPPPIAVRAFGYATEPGQPKKVFLLLGSDVYVATQNQTVEHRYQVLQIGLQSVLVKDLQSNQTAQIPLPPALVTPGGN